MSFEGNSGVDVCGLEEDVEVVSGGSMGCVRMLKTERTEGREWEGTWTLSTWTETSMDLLPKRAVRFASGRSSVSLDGFVAILGMGSGVKKKKVEGGKDQKWKELILRKI